MRTELGGAAEGPITGPSGFVGSGDLYRSTDWRRRPALLRAALSASELAVLGPDRLIEILARLTGMRVFVARARRTGVSQASFVPRPASVEVFRRLVTNDGRFTVLMNGVERVDPVVAAVQEAVGVPHRWRADDVVVTYSSPGSGIGYHAGHEDGFIVQAAGQRLWRVWDSDEVDAEARRRLILNQPDDIYPLQRSMSPPVLECELAPGDVLYLPPFAPHEGTTIERSISIALGWRGVAFYHLVLGFPGLVSPPDSLAPEDVDPLFDLLPDADPEAGAMGITSSVAAILTGLEDRGCLVTDRARLSDRLATLLCSVSQPVP